MKKISLEIIKLRIRLLQKILAIIGITAVIASCGGNSGDAEENDTDSIVTNMVDPDTVPVQDTIPVSEDPSGQTAPVQTNTPPGVPDMNKPDHPMTKYGVPFDDDEMKARYGVPAPSNLGEI
jgi:hypothetical protein